MLKLCIHIDSDDDGDDDDDNNYKVVMNEGGKMKVVRWWKFG